MENRIGHFGNNKGLKTGFTICWILLLLFVSFAIITTIITTIINIVNYGDIINYGYTIWSIIFYALYMLIYIIWLALIRYNKCNTKLSIVFLCTVTLIRVLTYVIVLFYPYIVSFYFIIIAIINICISAIPAVLLFLMKHKNINDIVFYILFGICTAASLLSFIGSFGNFRYIFFDFSSLIDLINVISNGIAQILLLVEIVLLWIPIYYKSICPKCGFENGKAIRFCGKCGCKIK